jgi:cytochrome oxidase Cu insertion factor (SCO1/SenC/PrrC family)
MPSRSRLIFALCTILAALLIGGAALWSLKQPPGPTATGTALVGGPFSLMDHTGRRVTDEDFRGRYMLVAFGYTYCPDVCPGELQLISAALDRLGAKADRIAPIFITVDPARDTQDVLKAYMANFHPRFVGLTGSEAEIAAAAKAYRVYFRKVESPGSPYLMDHTSLVYLMDPEGNYVTHFPYGTDVDGFVRSLEQRISH